MHSTKGCFLLMLLLMFMSICTVQAGTFKKTGAEAASCTGVVAQFGKAGHAPGILGAIKGGFCGCMVGAEIGETTGKCETASFYGVIFGGGVGVVVEGVTGKFLGDTAGSLVGSMARSFAGSIAARVCNAECPQK